MMKSKRILIIDDDQGVTGFLSSLLCMLGHRVDVSDNGTHGLKAGDA